MNSELQLAYENLHSKVNKYLQAKADYQATRYASDNFKAKEKIALYDLKQANKMLIEVKAKKQTELSF